MDTTGTAQTSSGSSQLGMAALKVAVNVQCLNKIETLPAWKSATKSDVERAKAKHSNRSLRLCQ